MKLRPFQEAALSTLQKPGHLICVAPTGSGKSLIFRRFLSLSRKRALIVFPLIALARQQVEHLRSDRIETYWPHDGTKVDPRAQVWALSPEHLFCGSDTRPYWNRLKDFQPEILIVDEAHCVWEWGRAFRPEFARLPEILQIKSITRSLWLSATLPEDARQTLVSALPTPVNVLDYSTLPDRLSLCSVEISYGKRKHYLKHFLEEHRGPGILFVSRRRDTIDLYRTLSSLGRNAIAYHGGMASDERRAIEDRIHRDTDSIVVATSAFGMGMDYPHLEWALLWQPPLTTLAFAQAVGRVGRSERPGKAVILWDESDFTYFKNWFPNQPENIRQLWAVKELLQESGSQLKEELLKHAFKGT